MNGDKEWEEEITDRVLHAFTGRYRYRFSVARGYIDSLAETGTVEDLMGVLGGMYDV